MLAPVMPGDCVPVHAALVANMAGVDEAGMEKTCVLAEVGLPDEALVALTTPQFHGKCVLQPMAVQLVWVLKLPCTQLADRQTPLSSIR